VTWGRLRRQFVVFGSAATLACLLASPVQAATSLSETVGFGVTPLRYDIDAKPGSRGSYDLTLTNTDDKPATFTFSRIDIQGDRDDPDATPVLFPGKFDSTISGYDWLEVPAALTIPGGGTRKVTIGVAPPAGAVGGHYAAVVVTGPSRSAGELVAQSRIAVPFLMNAGGAPPPEIKVTDVKEFVGGGTKIVYDNDGKVAVTPRPTVHLKNPITGRPNGTTTGTCTTALPGGSGTCTIDGTGRGGGSGSKGGGKDGIGANGGYVELVTEEGTRARSELPTEWAGTWSSMLLPLAGIILFVLYFLFLRRRRSGADDEVDLDDDLAFG
jgi:hypothetical protein